MLPEASEEEHPRQVQLQQHSLIHYSGGSGEQKTKLPVELPGVRFDLNKQLGHEWPIFFFLSTRKKNKFFKSHCGIEKKITQRLSIVY